MVSQGVNSEDSTTWGCRRCDYSVPLTPFRRIVVVRTQYNIYGYTDHGSCCGATFSLEKHALRPVCLQSLIHIYCTTVSVSWNRVRWFSIWIYFSPLRESRISYAYRLVWAQWMIGPKVVILSSWEWNTYARCSNVATPNRSAPYLLGGDPWPIRITERHSHATL